MTSVIADSELRRRWWMVLWLAVLAAGVWLRLWQIGIQISVDDEWHAIHTLMYSSAREIFLSFGQADYSVPLTLLFNALFETVGLSDRRMRLLPLAFGLVTLVLVPFVLRPWLDRRERWLLALLLALSPLLIFFARHVRPYALIVPLGLLATVALWRWWHERQPGWLALFFPTAVLAGWLHPLTTLLTGAALTWFAVIALAHWWREGRWQPFARIMAVGTATVAACAVLILPPLLVTPQAIAEKTGVHQIRADTVWQSWQLVIGSARPFAALVGIGLAALGAWQWWRRDPRFLLYWAWLLAFAIIVLVFLQPAWIINAMVLVRYTAVIQPIILALIATGAVWSLTQAGHVLRVPGRDMPVAVGAGLLGLLLYLAGPLPELYRGINQFTNALRYQADYDFERSIFAFMNEVETPAFYRRIADEPGDWEVVETPWYFETNQSPLTEYQDVHQRLIRIGMISGLCADWSWGEVLPDDRHRLVLRPFVFLTDILEQPPGVNRFVVFHRQRPFAHARELPDIEPCVDAFRQRFGQPWYEEEAQVVFRLPASTADEASGAESNWSR